MLLTNLKENLRKSKLLTVAAIAVTIVVGTACSSDDNSSCDEGAEASVADTLTIPPASPELANLGAPLDIPLVLSANFGELRHDHFHSGIDFKTQGTTGHKVYSVADGYVSRILVSPWGFGRAVYITHPSLGLTSVYGHLESFSASIDSLARSRQYASRSFNVDIELSPDSLPVKKGEVIALSGNAGTSFGPHLHFDIRDITSRVALDPLDYYKDALNEKDSTAPQWREITLFPKGGWVDSKSSLTPGSKDMAIKAWDEVVPAINAIDRMTGVNNVFGVKRIVLKVDGKEFFSREINKVDLPRSRDINALVHYPTLVATGEHLQHTYRPPTAPNADMIKGGGAISITEQRDYPCEYLLTDNYDNCTSVKFVIRGTPHTPLQVAQQGTLVHHDRGILLDGGDIKVGIPKGTLYDDAYIRLMKNSRKGIYQVGDYPIALSRGISIDLRVAKDTLKHKQQYCLVRFNDNGDRIYCGGKYADGRVSAQVNRLGRYAVAIDSLPPTVVPIAEKRWNQESEIRLKVEDDLSGIGTWTADIDGRWVCMELDGKSGTLSYRIDRSIFPNGQPHRLCVIVRDDIGNTRKVAYKF